MKCCSFSIYSSLNCAIYHSWMLSKEVRQSRITNFSLCRKVVKARCLPMLWLWQPWKYWHDVLAGQLAMGNLFDGEMTKCWLQGRYRHTSSHTWKKVTLGIPFKTFFRGGFNYSMHSSPPSEKRQKEIVSKLIFSQKKSFLVGIDQLESDSTYLLQMYTKVVEILVWGQRVHGRPWKSNRPSWQFAITIPYKIIIHVSAKSSPSRGRGTRNKTELC